MEWEGADTGGRPYAAAWREGDREGRPYGVGRGVVRGRPFESRPPKAGRQGEREGSPLRKRGP